MRSRSLGVHEVPAELDEPVVVVDVLRAFTTAAWIIDGGAPVLVLASSRLDALAEKARLGPATIAVTDGELGAGFELGNSPAQVRRFPLAGRPVVQTTANGTVGVHAARSAPLVLCASLLTASATAGALRESGADRVTYVITGHDGTAEEDLACADLIQATVARRTPPTDTLERVRRSHAAAGLRRGLAAGYPGVDEADLAMACEIDRFDFALRAQVLDGRTEVHPLRPDA